MGKFKLNNNVAESATALKPVETMLGDTYTDAKKLYDGINSMSWSGDSRNHFYAMMGIVLQYHKALDEVTSDIRKSIEELHDAAEDYDTYYAVKKLKEIE